MFDINYAEWANMLVRWLHITAGIAWIGSSFYFVFTDNSLGPNEDIPKKAHGETWQVHGGGFYHIVKYLVAPDKMPKILHWFKYEAYFTWISGFALLAVIYYWGAEAFLIDKEVMDLTVTQAIFLSVAGLGAGWVFYDMLCRSPLGERLGLLLFLVFGFAVFAAWAFGELFSGRAAFLHAGVLIGSIMVGNVFFVIIPNQKKVVKMLVAGETPDAKYGKIAKQRSMHNSYLTMPVLLTMISNHYAALYGGEYAWVVFACILAIGALIRHYYITGHAGIKAWWRTWLYPLAGGITVVMILWLSYTPAPSADMAEVEVDAKAAFQVVKTHCSTCHSSLPIHEAWDEAPNGVLLDTLDQMRALGDKIYAQSVAGKNMPLGNETNMTQEERDLLGQWIKAGLPGLDG
ncbi:MAG: urate hydroxylase PuuD [Alphaproteobacteria bacterium]|nr:urate hydroxylase PuuD [Alphaproteobacteria bacterium]